MPQCVAKYVETNNFELVRSTQHEILASYLNDMSKYNSKNETKKTRAEDILYSSADLNDFKGGMTENYVLNQLTAGGHICYSWQSDGVAEIDFVIQRGRELVPIEVKSAGNNQAKSLAVYMQKFKPKYAIKVSASNFGFENSIKTIPLYAAFCI